MINNQFSVFQLVFVFYGIFFIFVGIDKIVNVNWVDDFKGYEMIMKCVFCKGIYKDFNFYFFQKMGGNLGYCYFFIIVLFGFIVYICDGCIIFYSIIFGGSFINYNFGYIVIYEVGYWFGFYYIFQGGCIGVGDFVFDIFVQVFVFFGCFVGCDFCFSQVGVDFIYNYMDYFIDFCYEEFIFGQQIRINSFWISYCQNVF